MAALRESRELVLGIESSCDETAAAVVERGRVVLSSVIASQHDLHEEYKGVVPEIASRAHAERILPVVEGALAEAGVGLDDLKAVAVGNRPGLIGSLLVGVSAAKALAWSMGLPLVGVDHVHAHLYAGVLVERGGEEGAGVGVEFPALGLVVSGGHTSIYLMKSAVEIERIGSTIDDAIGEAYDKVASMLGLAFPGGPLVDALARTGNAKRFALPVSTLSKESLDFSFSGLKTAVKYAAFGVPAKRESMTTDAGTISKEMLADLCASFQWAATGAIVKKVERALSMHGGCRTLVVGGGVSANSLLRTRLAELAAQRKVVLCLPAMNVCLDNAAMIAGLGHAVLAERGWSGDALSMGAFAASKF